MYVFISRLSRLALRFFSLWVAPARLLPHILVDWPHLLWVRPYSCGFATSPMDTQRGTTATHTFLRLYMISRLMINLDIILLYIHLSFHILITFTYPFSFSFNFLFHLVLDLNSFTGRHPLSVSHIIHIALKFYSITLTFISHLSTQHSLLSTILALIANHSWDYTSKHTSINYQSIITTTIQFSSLSPI